MDSKEILSELEVLHFAGRSTERSLAFLEMDVASTTLYELKYGNIDVERSLSITMEVLIEH